MAKIIKVGSQNLTPNKIANPFRTSRNSTTNPFKYSNFQGNTLPFEYADVFGGAKSNTNKLRMIASSVAGSMNKMKSSIAEPIINFVNRVSENISSAWQYAKVTPFTTAVSDAANATTTAVAGAVNAIKENQAVRNMSEILNKEIELNINLPKMKGLSESMLAFRGGVASRMEAIQEGAINLRNDMRTQWEALIAKIPSKTHYTASTPVSELESAWKEIIALEGGIA